jgi:hypothetical protein
MSIEAMKQALEALEYCKHLAECQRVWGGTEWRYPYPWKRIFDSTTKSLHTIRTAIEQAEKQEPVARLMRFIGKDAYPKKGYTVARTYEECPENHFPNIWEEGEKLYTI